MLAVFNLKVIPLLLSTIMSVLSTLGVYLNPRMTAKDGENIRLNVSVISDTHIAGGTLREMMLRNGLNDIARAKTPVDALVISGDITDHGDAEQYDSVYRAFEKSGVPRNLILAGGNHDITHPDDGYVAATERFLDRYNTFTGRDIDKIYYSTVVNGYKFIVIGTEGQSGVKAYISEEQLEWLDAELADATAGGLPVFVISHYALPNTHGLPEVWDGGDLGKQGEQVKEILLKYDNVFFICGHLHSAMSGDIYGKLSGYQSVENIGSLHSINLPCYMYFNWNGTLVLSGIGFQIEVYDSEVVLRARSYSASHWLPTYEYKFPIV